MPEAPKEAKIAHQHLQIPMSRTPGEEMRK